MASLSESLALPLITVAHFSVSFRSHLAHVMVPVMVTSFFSLSAAATVSVRAKTIARPASSDNAIFMCTFGDQLTTINLGGSAMEEAGALRATLRGVAFMATVGRPPVLVHGGGKPIDRAMAPAGLQPRKVQGRRYTDDATLDIVVRVLRQTCDDIVADIRRLGGRAVGLHAGSLQCLFGERLLLPQPGGPSVDLGRVG